MTGQEIEQEKERDVRSGGERSNTLDYPLNEATRCHCFITWRKWERSRFHGVVPMFPTARLASVLFLHSILSIIFSRWH